MSRTVNVVRMQLINKQTYVWVPLLVLVGAFAFSLAIFALIPTDAPKVGGGAQAPLWYFLVVGIQSLTLTFPFSQALSVSRREFFIGTMLTAFGSSVVMALIFVIGGLIEEATDGWGINGWFFHLDWVWERGPLAAFVVFLIMTMGFFVTGFCAAALYRRFGMLWLTVALIGVGVLLLGAVAILSFTDSWGSAWRWFTQQGALELSLWALIGVAVLSAAGYGLLRRAVP